jgi:hypothetical protein
MKVISVMAFSSADWTGDPDEKNQFQVIIRMLAEI